MDNPAAPIPSSPSPLAAEPAVSSLPAESQSRRWLVWSAIGLIFLAIGITIGLFSAKFLSQPQPQSRLSPTPIPTITLTPSLSVTPAKEADPTVNWEIYTNIENGYSLKYPKQGFLRLICPREELIVTNDGVGNKVGPIEMSTCARGFNYTLETKTYNSIQPEPGKTRYYTVEEKSINLGGTQAKQYIFTFTNIERGPFSLWYTLARVSKNGKTYEIYFDEKESLHIFDQILSTFQFTN